MSKCYDPIDSVALVEAGSGFSTLIPAHSELAYMLFSASNRLNRRSIDE